MTKMSLYNTILIICFILSLIALVYTVTMVLDYRLTPKKSCMCINNNTLSSGIPNPPINWINVTTTIDVNCNIACKPFGLDQDTYLSNKLTIGEV